MSSIETGRTHVVHVFQSLNFSGAEVMYTQAAPLFLQKGFDLTAIATQAEFGNYIEQFKQSGFTVQHMPQPKLSISNLVDFVLYFFRFYRFLINTDAAVLHIHRSTNYWFYSLCGYFAGTRTIRTFHSVFKNRKITWLKAYIERLTARKLLNVIFQSIGESVQRNEAIYYKSVTTRVNNWFDARSFYPPSGADEIQQSRSDVGLSFSDFVIISVGGCSEIKNHSDIIRALALLPGDFNYLYLHLGSGHLEEEERTLAAKVLPPGRVRFIGNTTEVRKYLIASDVFVMTSKLEGLGNAAVEAMGCGLPLVLYDVPGLRDLIQNSNNGLLVQPSYQALASALMRLAEDQAIRTLMGKNAQCNAIASFSMHANVAKIIDLYLYGRTSSHTA